MIKNLSMALLGIGLMIVGVIGVTIEIINWIRRRNNR